MSKAYKFPVTIGGKEYQLKFDLGFINHLDNVFPLQFGEDSKMSGSSIGGMGMGMQGLYYQLTSRSPLAILNAIQAGTSRDNSKPSVSDIEDYIAELDDEEWIFKQIEEGLAQSVFTKRLYPQNQL